MDTKARETLQKWVSESNNIVFFGGAGVSTESGVPDFRSVDGLYNQKYDYPPETILSHTFFRRMPEEFFKFYRDKLLIDGIEPNKAHKKLAELEKAGKLKAVITQNIDGLHQAAGSIEVMEVFLEIIVRAAENSMMKNISRTLRMEVFQNAAAAAVLSRMLFYTKKALIQILSVNR